MNRREKRFLGETSG